MRQAGVWSFRTTTGIARVVDGSLRTRHTLRGLTIGTYRRGSWTSLLRPLAFGVGSFGIFGSAVDLVEAVINGGVSGVVSAAGVATLVGFVGLLGMLCLPLVTEQTTVDIYDMTDVTVDADDRELTIQYTDDGGDRETTTVEVADDEALGEAVSVLSLKGAPVDEALVEEWV